MKIIIFGLGKNYERVKYSLEEEMIVALSDNAQELWWKAIDGRIVIPPQKIVELEYDIIVITCKCWKEVIDQLVQLGVDSSKIYNFLEYPMIIGEGRRKFFLTQDENGRIGDILFFAYEMIENGASIAMIGAIEALTNNGFQVDVICYNDGPIRESLCKRGISVLLYSEVWTNKYLLTTIVKNYSLIIINSVQQYRIVDRLSNSETKILWWIHEPPYFYESYLRNDSIEAIQNRNCMILFVSAISKSVFQNYISNSCLPSLILSPGIEDKYIEKKRIVPNTLVTIAVVGHICEEKGQELLLDALNLLNQTIIDSVKVLLIGEIPNNDFGKRIRAKIKLRHNVILIGKMKNADIHQLYNDNQVDVVVCPSRIETFSLAAVEGLMHEKTVIVSSNTGIADFITNGINGYVFEDGNVAELARLLTFVVEHKDKLSDVGKAARRTFVDELSVSALQRNFNSIISKVEVQCHKGKGTYKELFFRC